MTVNPAQLLVWSSYTPYTYLGHGNTITGMLDLTNNNVTEANITNTQHDMFCPGARCGVSCADSFLQRCLPAVNYLTRTPNRAGPDCSVAARTCFGWSYWSLHSAVADPDVLAAFGLTHRLHL